MYPLSIPWAGVAPGRAVIETIGRRSGKTRLTPVGGRLPGDTYWLIAFDGRRAQYLRNIESNPDVRVRDHGRVRRKHCSYPTTIRNAGCGRSTRWTACSYGPTADWTPYPPDRSSTARRLSGPPSEIRLRPPRPLRRRLPASGGPRPLPLPSAPPPAHDASVSSARRPPLSRDPKFLVPPAVPEFMT